MPTWITALIVQDIDPRNDARRAQIDTQLKAVMLPDTGIQHGNGHALPGHTLIMQLIGANPGCEMRFFGLPQNQAFLIIQLNILNQTTDRAAQSTEQSGDLDRMIGMDAQARRVGTQLLGLSRAQNCTDSANHRQLGFNRAADTLDPSSGLVNSFSLNDITRAEVSVLCLSRGHESRKNQ